MARKRKGYQNAIPLELARWYPAFHGHDIDTVFRIDDVDPEDFARLGLLGRFRFMAYEPPRGSELGDLLLIHHGGDHGAAGAAHERCPTCGMILFMDDVPHEELPFVTRTARGTAVAVLGNGLRVTDLGIKG